ncbi:glycosyltransferase, partial [Acinetobacter baumannii]
YGLFFCKGKYLTIYDAEDVPDSDQLKKVVALFRKLPKDYIVLQGALNYFNKNENLLTRMFTLEYSYWFDYMLPGLQSLDVPIPL